MFSLLTQTLLQRIDFSEEEIALMLDLCTLKRFSKSEIIVNQGDFTTDFYFINKGLLRLYYLNEIEENTLVFCKEGMFCTSLESMLSGDPSTQILQCIEDAEVVCVPFYSFKLLIENHPNFNRFYRYILEHRLIEAQKIVAMHTIYTPEERYHWFCKAHPEYLQRIPLNLIATFLGITPVSLSRIRGRAARN